MDLKNMIEKTNHMLFNKVEALQTEKDKLLKEIKYLKEYKIKVLIAQRDLALEREQKLRDELKLLKRQCGNCEHSIEGLCYMHYNDGIPTQITSDWVCEKWEGEITPTTKITFKEECENNDL